MSWHVLTIDWAEKCVGTTGPTTPCLKLENSPNVGKTSKSIINQAFGNGLYHLYTIIYTTYGELRNGLWHCFTHKSMIYFLIPNVWWIFVAAFIFFSMQSHDSTPVAARITWWLSKCREGDIFLSIWRELKQTKFFLTFPDLCLLINWGKPSCCFFVHFPTWTCRVPAHFPSRSAAIRVGWDSAWYRFGFQWLGHPKNDQKITGI